MIAAGRKQRLGQSRILSALLATCLYLACGEAPEPPQLRAVRLDRHTLVSLEYSKGNIPGGTTLTLLDDNSVILNVFSPEEERVRLAPQDRAEMSSFLASPSFDSSVRHLQASTFKPGTTDMPEVAFIIRGSRYGYPVCSRGPLVEPPVRDTIEWFNRFGRKHFGKSYTEVPARTCREGFTADEL